jgi:hypothetical protein
VRNQSFISSLKPITVFRVPKGYFKGFYSKLMERIKGMKSQRKPVKEVFPLEGYTPLQALSRDIRFNVPKNYFQQLPSRIEVRLQASTGVDKLELEELWGFELSLHKTMPFNLPEDYFNAMTQRLMSRLEREPVPADLDFSALENAEIGILKALSKSPVFETPQGYFDKPLSIPGKGVNEGSQASGQKGNSTTRPLLRQAIIKTMALAAVLSTLVLGYVFWINQPATQTSCKELLCEVSQEELLRYVEQHGIREGVLLDAAASGQLEITEDFIHQTQIGQDALLDAISTQDLESAQ